MRHESSSWRNGPETGPLTVVSTYPLAPLLDLRREKVQHLEGKCAAQSAILARAQGEVSRLITEIDSVCAAAAAEQRRQIDHAGRSGVLVRDFQQAAAHQIRQRLRVERLTAAKVKATATIVSCQVRVEEANRELLEARRQLAVVQRHMKIFLNWAKRIEEGKVEEDAAEVWQAHRTLRFQGGR